MMRFFLISLAALSLSACGEFDQSVSSDRHQPDTPAWKGANNIYVEKGWTPGDKVAWESHLRNRVQHQNEYMRAN